MKSALTPSVPLHRRLKMRHLELLAAMDANSSLHGASRAISVTQPAASKLINEAETAVGTALFTRSRKGMTATPAGTVLIARAKRMLGLLDGVREELAAVEEGASGLVRVGVYGVAAAELVPHAAKWLRDHGPRILVQMEDGNSNVLLDRLRGGSLECVIGRLYDNDDASLLTFDPLYSEPIVVAGRPAHPLLRRGRQATWADAAACDWVLPQSGAPLRQMFSLWFARHALPEPKCIFQSVSISANVTMVHESDALVMLPSTVAHYYSGLKQLKILPLKFSVSFPPVSLIRRRGEPPDSALDSFLSAVRKVMPKARSETAK